MHTANKILTRDQIATTINSLRASQNQTIGFTSGVYDLLHRGHAQYLTEARQKCDFLIVGVNSDSSVKSYKSPTRPICGELDRAYLVAQLSSVDCVFIFQERNNSANIEALKPDIYFKAGDYDLSKLSSAKLVQAYGGRVEIIPFLSGYSSTQLIEKAAASLGILGVDLPAPAKEMKPAIFIDRDGTIIEHIEYLNDPARMQLLPESLTGLRHFQDLNFRLIIVTNQQGIGLGYLSREDFFRVNLAMLKDLSHAGICIDKILFCPHSKAEGCNCRKPDTGLIQQAVLDLNIDLPKSYVIGDTTADLELGRRLGCKNILVTTGKAGKDGSYDTAPDHTATGLADAARIIESFLR